MKGGERKWIRGPFHTEKSGVVTYVDEKVTTVVDYGDHRVWYPPDSLEGAELGDRILEETTMERTYTVLKP